MLNILINAYAVSPNWGSEPGVGWNWITRIAKTCNVFVITEGEWQKDIEEAVKKLPQRENLHFYFNNVPQTVRDMCWNQGDWRFYHYYRLWQKKTLQIAQEIIAIHKIDVIHQLNMIGFREPGYLWRIKDIPFVWGPIGNMSPMNMEFAANLPLSSKLKLSLKNWITYYQARSGRVRKAIKKADTVYTALEDTAKIVKSVYGKDRVFALPETGLEITSDHTHAPKETGPINLLWVGRFIPTKKLDLALEILSKLPQYEFHLNIVGWGSSEEEALYKGKAKSLNVECQCTWYGKIPNTDVQQLMKENDIFFFTSVVEGTPHVILEAISNNLPIVCFDMCGQGVIVNEKVGIKINPGTLSEMKEGMICALQNLSRNKSYLFQLSKGCEERKPELSWDSKIKEIINTYKNAVKHKTI